MNDLNDTKYLLAEWLVGTVIASITFAAGFTIRLERSTVSDDKPNVLELSMRSTTRVGSEADWQEFIESMPLQPRRGEEDEPALAYRLMLLIGADINDVELHDDGSISISTTDGEAVFLSGIEDVWEESWVLEISEETKKENPRSVVCSSDGRVFVT